ncbi:Psy4 protein [Maudiozyma humilis]|uniref:Psy4 protein n=1 Tax=Maudiozyma humilis TaxID=51915 RepID=A0AAV5S528_MAUHU|nr:Psy4 protein [Kazachstania humilis]
MEVMTDAKELGLEVRDEEAGHMHGIKSEALYAFLQKVALGAGKADEAQDDQCMALFRDTAVADVLGPLLEHVQITIPSELFLRSSAADQERIAHVCASLRDNFLQTDRYPFTIRRICELCFDPFRYFRPSELTKFVNALEKCCLVTTALDTSEASPDPEDHKKVELPCTDDDEDVSLVRIPWLDDSGTKVGPKFLRFLKEIDGIMSENFQLDADEEDEEDDMGGDGDIAMGGMPSTLTDDPDVIVEEYYEDPGKEDEYPGQGMLGGVDVGDDDEEDADDADYNGADDDEDNSTSEDEEADADADADENIDTATESKTPRKRKPTELDTFDYSDVSVTRLDDDLTTPKKHKQDDTLVIQSPVDMAAKAETVVATASISMAPEAGEGTPANIIPGPGAVPAITTGPSASDSVLFSPSAGPSHETPTSKILPITTEGVDNSPLGNKTR